MLQSMRNKIKGLVAVFLIALLTIPLALVGVENLFYGNNNIGEAAEVDGEIISERELQIAVARERQRLQAQLGNNIPAEYLSDERLRTPALEGLIQRQLVSQVADNGNMTVSSENIDRTITTLPEFQVDGVFDGQRFLQTVRNIGHTTTSFRELLKQDMLVNQMQGAIVSSDFITDAEIGYAIALSRQTRDFSWLTLPIGNLADTIVVSEEDIAAHYEDNKSTYLSEEQVAIEYIDLNLSDLEKDVSVNEDDVRQQYEQVVQQFTASTQREAAHIMVEGDDDAAKEKIATVQEKLAAGGDFSALASEYSDDFGSRDNGGNLGVSSGDGFPEDFEAALLDLTEGQISEPVVIDNATHFIKLIKVTEKTPPTYEDEKVGIEAELKRAQAENLFIEKVQELEELAYNAESLEEVGKSLGLAVTKTALFSRESIKQGILQDSRITNAAFSSQVIQEGHASNVLELSSDRSVVLKLIDHKPVRTLTLEEKTAEITAEIKQSRAKAQVAAQAKTIREALDSGKSIGDVAESQSLSVSTQVAAQRNAADVPAELISAIFEMPHPAKEGEVGLLEQHLENGDYVVVSLSKVTEGSLDDLSEAERVSLRTNLSSSLAGDEYRAWQDELRAESEVEIYSSQYSGI